MDATPPRQRGLFGLTGTPRIIVSLVIIGFSLFMIVNGISTMLQGVGELSH